MLRRLPRYILIWVPIAALVLVYWFAIFLQPSNTGDEIIDVPAATALIQGAGPETLQTGHPPLGTYLTALSLLFFGNPRIIGGFLASVTFVTLFTYLIRNTKKGVAIGVAVLLVANPLFIEVMSLAMLEVFWVSFAALGFLAVSVSKERRNWILLSGLLFGCALASKWAAIPSVFAAAIYLAIVSRKRLELLPGFFLLIVVVYLAANIVAIGDLGLIGFVQRQLLLVASHEKGVGAMISYSLEFRRVVAPVMTLLGFTNALYLAPYVPHLFLFNTYWRFTYSVNPGLWVTTIPGVILSVYRLVKEYRKIDLLWLLFFAAAFSVIYLTPKFFLFYFDALAIPQAYVIAASIPNRIRVPYYVFATLLPVLLLLGPFSH